MMSEILSNRALETVAALDRPWRFAPRGTYDPDRNPSGIICFGSAENGLVTEEVDDFVKTVVIPTDALLYRGSHAGGIQFPKALANHVNEYFQPHTPITSDMIQVVGAATAMHDMLAWGVADPGDGILASRPVYGRFELDFGNKSHAKIVYADTDATNCFDEDVVGKFEKALQRSNAVGVRIKAVLIVNPHNPLGRCYPRNTLVNIIQFCQKHNLHLISDEIYACSVFDSSEPGNVPFTSILSIDSNSLIDAQLLHVTYGLSKDFGAAGLRIGAIITRSKPVLQAVDAVMRFHNPSGPALAIGTAMLENRQWCRAFITESRRRIGQAYKHVTKCLREIGVDYLPGSNAGFFIWIDLSPFLPTDLDGEENAEFSLAKNLTDAGVFLHPREEHSMKPGWFRVVYTHDPRTVTEGIRRIKMAIS